jgi:hypothetical protein
MYWSWKWSILTKLRNFMPLKKGTSVIRICLPRSITLFISYTPTAFNKYDLYNQSNWGCNFLSFASVNMKENKTSGCQDLFIECCFVPSVSCLYRNKRTSHNFLFDLWCNDVMREVKFQWMLDGSTRYEGHLTWSFVSSIRDHSLFISAMVHRTTADI